MNDAGGSSPRSGGGCGICCATWHWLLTAALVAAVSFLVTTMLETRADLNEQRNRVTELQESLNLRLWQLEASVARFDKNVATSEVTGWEEHISKLNAEH